jgi:hypothetical protein
VSGCQGNSGLGRDQWDGRSPESDKQIEHVHPHRCRQGAWYNPQIFGLLGGSQVSQATEPSEPGDPVFNGTISASYVFGPHLFLDAYFGYDRGDLWANQPNQDKNLGWTCGIPGLNTSSLSLSSAAGGMPMLAIDGFGTVGRSARTNHSPTAIPNGTTT